MTTSRSVLLTGFVSILLVSCGAIIPQHAWEAYTVRLDPATFAEAIDNPSFLLQPGCSYLHEAVTDDGVERTQVDVLAERREILGISAAVVRDTVTLDGVLVEDTHDW